jgi:hypothetical protein
MPRPSRLGPHALNERLSKLADPLDVLREFSTHGHAYDEINLATVWTKLSRAQGSSLSLIKSDNA